MQFLMSLLFMVSISCNLVHVDRPGIPANEYYTPGPVISVPAPTGDFGRNNSLPRITSANIRH
jgi:hypothetical protein